MISRVNIDRAARVLDAGGIVAYPTEAVYGLGCRPDRRDAVMRLLRIKRRAWRKGFVVIAASLEDLDPFVELPHDVRREHILATWPGPVTWVLAARGRAPPWLTGGRRTLAVRVTAHPVARALCERARSALISTSANVSGRPPHTRLVRLRLELGSRVDYVLAGELGGLRRPTEIRDGATGAVLRPG